MKQVLVTKPEQGTTLWGLVEEGRKQAKAVRHLAMHTIYLKYLMWAASLDTRLCFPFEFSG